MFDDTEPDPREQLSHAIDVLAEKTRQIGLYYQGSSIGVNDPELAMKLQGGELSPTDVLESGNNIMIIATFTIGGHAFSQGVVDPEQEKINRQAQAILPSDTEMEIEQLREKLKNGNIEDLFD